MPLTRRLSDGSPKLYNQPTLIHGLYRRRFYVEGNMTCSFFRRSLFMTVLTVCGWSPELLQGGQIVTNPFGGTTLLTRTETSPRTENMHIAEIDLKAQGI